MEIDERESIDSRNECILNNYKKRSKCNGNKRKVTEKKDIKIDERVSINSSKSKHFSTKDLFIFSYTVGKVFFFNYLCKLRNLHNLFATNLSMEIVFKKCNVSERNGN